MTELPEALVERAAITHYDDMVRLFWIRGGRTWGLLEPSEKVGLIDAMRAALDASGLREAQQSGDWWNEKCLEQQLRATRAEASLREAIEALEALEVSPSVPPHIRLLATAARARIRGAP